MSPTTIADPSLIPDIETFEERAAIAEYDAGLNRKQAEDLAAQAQGFASAGDYWSWLADYVVNRGLS
jgi:hypothetical protein